MNGPVLERRLSARGPWRVFLSHTSDLRDYPEDCSFVAAAEAAVMRAGHAVADMAYFTARDMEPAEFCSRMVGQADVYVGIIGLRYGAVVRGRPELSYTELEFDEATALGLHRLIFIIREGPQPDFIVDQPDEETARQADFRRRLLDAGLTTAWIRSASELQTMLHQSLVELQSELQHEATPPPQRVLTARQLLHPMSDDGAVRPHFDAAWLSDLWDRLDQPHIGEAISLLRQHSDLTRAQLIDRMCQVSEEQNPGLDPSLVYRWEKGEKGRPGPRPRPRYRRLLAQVCENELRLMSAPRRSELLRRLRALTASPVVAGPTVLDPGRHALVGSPDGSLLDGMAALTRSYVLLHNTVAPLAVRTAITRHFEDLTALTLKSHAPSSSATIRSLAAQTAILAGWVSFNLQDLTQAFMYWSVAHDLAREAGNVSVQAHALGSRSRLHSPIHRDPGEADPAAALALLDQAVRLAERSASPALRSWLLANRAQQLAVTGQATASYRDLEASAHYVSLAEQGDEDVLSGWDEVRVDAYRGICAMALGRPGEVIEITESVLARTDPGRVQRSLQQADLAAAYALRGDVDQACVLLGEALTVASRAQFPEGVQRVRTTAARYMAGRAETRTFLRVDATRS